MTDEEMATLSTRLASFAVWIAPEIKGQK